MNESQRQFFDACLVLAKRWAAQANQRFRMWQWWLITLLAGAVIADVAPHKLGTTLYAVSLLAVAFIMGYWGDRLSFPKARPHQPLDAALECNQKGMEETTTARDLAEGEWKPAEKEKIKHEIDQCLARARIFREEAQRLYWLAMGYQMRRTILMGSCALALCNRL